jgi:hypothetical protein
LSPSPSYVAPESPRRGALFSVAAVLLLALMGVLAGGAALRESVTLDEVAHIGAGVTYLQKFELRLNGEHPPLPKIIAALPLVLRGVHADYSHISWTFGEKFFPAYVSQWVFGDWLLTKWNDEATVLAWARFPMLLLTLALGCTVFRCGRRLGGDWAGLLCLTVFATTPAFLAFGPLVLTDMAVTLFSLLTIWSLADMWKNPTKRSAFLFGTSFAAALLCKFTAGILFFVLIAFALSTRWRPLPGQPRDKAEARVWRKLRWRCTRRGILWAALLVYLCYFLFSIRQTTDVLFLLGHGPAWIPVRRLLMPPWLYLRGVAFVLLGAKRPTFILGHSYTHGVWFYYPVVFMLKSALGFLGLLVLGLILWTSSRQRRKPSEACLREGQEFHWRALSVALIVFLAFSLLSPLAISIRHFSVPLVLLIFLLAPVPRMLERIRVSNPSTGRIATGLAAVLALSCLFTAVRAYPYYIPYVNALRFGRPIYTLLNDSNVDWNQSLPEVKRYADLHHLEHIKVDEYGFTEVTDYVPNAEIWDCQKATAADAGSRVVISGGMMLDGHNCAWLLPFPWEPIAGGSMYVVQLPSQISPPGSPGGPPAPSDYRTLGGMPFDVRTFFLEMIRYPEKLPSALAEMQARFEEAQKAPRKPSSAPKDTK